MTTRPTLLAALLATILLAPTVAHSQRPTLLLFGGSNHKTFLGCLTCGRFASNSVCWKYGDHGSRYNPRSIWNPYGEFGSKFSMYSPWNQFASDPPVIVDPEGNFYGYFTANKYKPKRTTIKFFLAFLDNIDLVTSDLNSARDLFCDE